MHKGQIPLELMSRERSQNRHSPILEMVIGLGLLTSTIGCEAPSTQAATGKPIIPLDAYALISTYPEVSRHYGWGIGLLPIEEVVDYKVLRSGTVRPGEQLPLPIRVEREWWQNKKVFLEFSDDIANVKHIGFPLTITDRMRSETFSVPASLSSHNPIVLESEILKLQGTMIRPAHYLQIKRTTEPGLDPLYEVQFLERIERKKILLEKPVILPSPNTDQSEYQP